MKEVRVRFAPSPTGPLHIGGVRTALYNYLFSKKNGRKMILRIEDTDQTRFVPGAEQYIVESLDRCGIKFNESDYVGGDFGPYKQSNRKHLYKQNSDELLAKAAPASPSTLQKNYRKRYYKGELPRKQTFESLVCSTPNQSSSRKGGKTLTYRTIRAMCLLFVGCTIDGHKN